MTKASNQAKQADATLRISGQPPMLAEAAGETIQRVTVSLPKSDAEALRAVAETRFAGNASKAATWAVRFMVLALDAEALRDRQISSPDATLDTLTGQPDRRG